MVTHDKEIYFMLMPDKISAIDFNVGLSNETDEIGWNQINVTFPKFAISKN